LSASMAVLLLQLLQRVSCGFEVVLAVCCCYAAALI
jgi:hypothetical protein